MEKGFGLSEEIIGRWMAQRGSRNDIVLATKVYQPMGLGPNDRRLSALHIRRACEDSLRRLQTDHIDLYQMHHIDRFTPWEEIWQAMELLVQQGKIIYVGSSNFAGWDIATAQGAASQRHFMGLVTEQSLYNLSSRVVELEVIPACRHYGLGLIPWSPLGGGLLGGVLKKAASGRRAGPAMKEKIEQYRPQLEAYEALCEDLGELPADVGLAWLLHNPVVTAPLVGPRTTGTAHADAARSGNLALRRHDAVPRRDLARSRRRSSASLRLVRGLPATKPALFVKLNVEWNRKVSFLNIAMARAFYLFIDQHDETRLALPRINERSSKVHAAF